MNDSAKGEIQNDDTDESSRFTEVLLCAILCWQLVAFAAVRIVAGDEMLWMPILAAFPSMAIYLSLRALAQASGSSRKKRFTVATVIALFTLPTLCIVHRLWEVWKEPEILTVFAVLVVVCVAGFIRKWPLPSQRPRRVWIDLAAGVGILCSIVAVVLGVIAWQTRSIRGQAMQRWERSGRSWAAFEKRIAAHRENDSLRQFGEDARPYGFGIATPGSRKSSSAKSLLLTRDDIGKTGELLPVAFATSGDRLSFEGKDTPWLDAHSAGLSDVYRRILSRPPPDWPYERDFSRTYDANGEWFRRVSSFCGLVVIDSLYRLARGDIESAHLATRAARRLACSFHTRPDPDSLNFASALEMWISCVEARLPQEMEVEAPPVPWQTQLADELQFESWCERKALDDGGDLSQSDLVLRWSDDSDLQVHVPYWLASVWRSRERAVELDATDALRVDAIENAVRLGPVSVELPGTQQFSAIDAQLAAACREQAGIIRRVRKEGPALGGQFPSAVIAGSTWIAKPVAGVPGAIDLSLTPPLEKQGQWTMWSSFPKTGGRWQFAPAPPGSR